MADRQKVIKGLECCWDAQSGWKDARYVCPTCPYTDNGIPCETLAPLMEDALALLKAQEPVEPIPTEDDDWICGACNNSVVGTTEIDAGGLVPVRFNYCQNCGRAVKWDG